jgi:hypothetical protein
MIIHANGKSEAEKEENPLISFEEKRSGYLPELIA